MSEGDGCDVLNVVPAYFPIQGGIETLVRQSADQLRHAHGVHSAVLVPRRTEDPWGRFELEGTPVVPILMPKPPEGEDMHSDERFATVTRTFAAVRRALAELRPRVVHIHANSEISLPAYTVARASGIPVIMHVHGEIDRELSPAYLKQVRECDVVVAVSEPVATSIRRVVGREGPVQVIVNGIAPHPREILDVPADPVPLVLMVGRLEEAKGFDDVVRALAVSRFPDAEAVIIGQGAWGEVIEQVGREVGVAPRVRMLGRVEHEQVLGWMRRARVVAVPSRHTEGFSLVAAEAGLCHRPVVATRVGGLPITVDDGATGTLVGPGDVAALAAAIDAYLQSPALAEQHGDAGARRIAREFGMPAYCAALAELYGRVDQTHPRVTHA